MTTIAEQLRVQRMYDEAQKNDGTRKPSTKSGTDEGEKKRNPSRSKKPQVHDLPGKKAPD